MFLVNNINRIQFHSAPKIYKFLRKTPTTNYIEKDITKQISKVISNQTLTQTQIRDKVSKVIMASDAKDLSNKWTDLVFTLEEFK